MNFSTRILLISSLWSCSSKQYYKYTLQGEHGIGEIKLLPQKIRPVHRIAVGVTHGSEVDETCYS